MQSVVVESILWQGRQGGAIFNARALSGDKYRIVAGAKVMPRPPVAGEVWEIEGTIRRHPDFGEQVGVKRAVLQKPSGRLIIQTIAASKAFPGIGERKTKALWDAFGERLYELLSVGSPEPFKEVLGPDLARVLIDGWKALETEAAVFQWLDLHGVPVWLAKKLLAIYGREVTSKLEENPYRLLAFTSWREADRVGRAMGIAREDPRRLVAAAEAACYERLCMAHTWTSRESFVTGVGRILGCGRAIAAKAAERALDAHAIVFTGDGIQGLGPCSMERFIAARILAMAERGMSPRHLPAEHLDRICAAFTAQTGFILNEAQRKAVSLAATNPIACITGGAGVGKTTVLKAIHMACELLGLGEIYQMALSGRAAKRMRDATGREAYTIAAFIKAVDSMHIKLDHESLLIVDEASMLDLPYCYRILRRMMPGARLILVGDSAQLPPIGFGLAFHAFVGEIPTVELTEIHRQAADTGIPQVSVEVRRGEVPALARYSRYGVGVSFLEADPTKIVDRIMDVVDDLGGIGNCQVIGPVKNGPAGVRTVNQVFHDLIAAGRTQRQGFAEGEPVIWTVNNYDLGLLNGSLGRVKSVREGLLIDFDGTEHLIEDPETKDMELAYAITVHKSQGSQFERVVIPVFESRLLDRTLLYTAITRAEKQAILIGSRDAFERAVVAAPSPSRRETGMKIHLCRKPG
jgi:exodeoxyribonuclease V alpha subunit